MLVSLYKVGYVNEACKQQQAGSKLNVDVDYVIHERGHNLSVYTYLFI